MKILKFGAVWCKECLVMNSIWEEIETDMANLEVEYYDADEHPEILKKYNVGDIPVFIFLDKEGSEILRLNGAQNKEELLNIIKEQIIK